MHNFCKIKLLLIISLLGGTFNSFALSDLEQNLMQEHGMSKKKIMLHADNWGVNPSKIDVDGYVYKGQGKSLINWKMTHHMWLDFNKWKEQRTARDTMPEWKVKLREAQHVESIGRVIKCYGICNVFRGRNDINADYMSRIYEGDELITSEDSYAWVALADGSVFRISPKSSITFNEINIGVKDYFYFVRLNHGHIHWQIRKTGKYQEKNLAETDLMFYPFMLAEVNREYYSRIEYNMMDQDDRLLYQTRKNPGHVLQYKRLNELLAENAEVLNKKNIKVFMVTANSSYLIENSHFDLFYATNGESKFRFKKNLEGFEDQDKRKAKVTALLRGYNNRIETILSENTWYKVNRKGKSIDESDFSDQFKTIELFTKRTPSIHLAREFIIRKNFKHLLYDGNDPAVMATKYGYRLWDEDGKEFAQRYAYLKEYTRRVETTNITSMAKTFKDRKTEDFDSSYYHRAISLHMKKLKNLYNKNRSVVPELSDLQFYIWILKYAKKE